MTGSATPRPPAQSEDDGGRDRLGVRSRLRRRRDSAGLRRGARRREGHHGGWFPAPGVGFYRRHGVRSSAVMTDNGAAYRSAIHALACRALGLHHLSTRPYAPADQRQGRALHPHDARWLGLRSHLPQLRRANREPSRAGYGATTSGDHTAPLAEGRRSSLGVNKWVSASRRSRASSRGGPCRPSRPVSWPPPRACAGSSPGRPRSRRSIPSRTRRTGCRPGSSSSPGGSPR